MNNQDELKENLESFITKIQEIYQTTQRLRARQDARYYK